MPNEDKIKPFMLTNVRVTRTQETAITKAMSNYCRKHGRAITVADIVREHGCAKFCADNGVVWPKE